MIITLDELKTYLNISDTSEDGRLQFIVDALPTYIEQKTRILFGCTSTETEVHDYRPVIFLDHKDIRSIEYIKRGYSNTGDYDNDTTLDLIDSSNYQFNDVGRVMLQRSYGHPPTRFDYNQIAVKYKYGRENVPANIKLAALEFARDSFADIDGRITSESLDSYRVSYAPSETAKEIFNSYA